MVGPAAESFAIEGVFSAAAEIATQARAPNTTQMLIPFTLPLLLPFSLETFINRVAVTIEFTTRPLRSPERRAACEVNRRSCAASSDFDV
jgi:hypothetical protein